MTSVRRYGTPRKGPSGAVAASARALSARVTTTELSCGSILPMRSRVSSTSSAGVTSPRRTSSAWAVASMNASGMRPSRGRSEVTAVQATWSSVQLSASGSAPRLSRPSEGGYDLGGCALPGPHRALHVVHPDRGGLGPRPVDAAERLPQHRAVPRPPARPEVAAEAAARPRLGRPVGLHVVRRPRGAFAEVPAEHLQDGLAALPGGEPGQSPRIVAL